MTLKEMLNDWWQNGLTAVIIRIFLAVGVLMIVGNTIFLLVDKYAAFLKSLK